MNCGNYIYQNNGSAGGIVVSADGTNSVVDLSGLQVFTGSAGGAMCGSQMQPSNGGQILVPNLGSASGLSLYVAGGMTFSLPSLTNFVNGSFFNSCTFQATGAGSLLDMPALQTITGPYYAQCYLRLQALQGARLNLKNVTAMYCGNYIYQNNGSAGGIVVSADGTNSAVDLSGLQVFTASAGGAAVGSLMQSSTGGQIIISNLVNATALSFDANGTNSIIYLTGLLTYTGPGTLSQENGGLIMLNTNTAYSGVNLRLAPAFITGPQSHFTVGTGLTVTYSIAVSASTPVYFQWYSNSVPIAGGTGSTLVLNNAQPSWSGNGYSVVVSNAYGTATSPVATLTIPTAPLYTSVSGSGVIQVSPSAANYYLGQTFTLTAIPGPYNAFGGWSDAYPGNPRSIVINSNNYYTASFTNTVPPMGVMQLSGQTVVAYPLAGTNYTLMTTTNLATGPWVPATNGVPLAAFMFTNDAPARFYQLR